MGSTRLSGKVLKPLGSQSMLRFLIERLRCARTVDSIVVATTTETRDDPIVEETARAGASSFRGSEKDVLERYVQAAQASHADIVVRVTGDNPFTDPESIDRVVHKIIAGYNYAIEMDLPVGVTGEALSMAALQMIHHVARTDAWREHVTLYAKQNPQALNCAFLKAPTDLVRPEMSFTVDLLSDYEYVRELCRDLSGPNFSLKELIAIADRAVVAESL
jgi:spore coat polysaccharide biosynthesis protein SpsF